MLCDGLVVPQDSVQLHINGASALLGFTAADAACLRMLHASAHLQCIGHVAGKRGLDYGALAPLHKVCLVRYHHDIIDCHVMS